MRLSVAEKPMGNASRTGLHAVRPKGDTKKLGCKLLRATAMHPWRHQSRRSKLARHRRDLFARELAVDGSMGRRQSCEVNAKYGGVYAFARVACVAESVYPLTLRRDAADVLRGLAGGSVGRPRFPRDQLQALLTRRAGCPRTDCAHIYSAVGPGRDSGS
jgi:hypothetical protein